MALSVFLAVKYVPENEVHTKELLIVSAIASLTFALMDMVSPSIKINKEPSK
jgi:hypothetical protein